MIKMKNQRNHRRQSYYVKTLNWECQLICHHQWICKSDIAPLKRVLASAFLYWIHCSWFLVGCEITSLYKQVLWYLRIQSKALGRLIKSVEALRRAVCKAKILNIRILLLSFKSLSLLQKTQILFENCLV